MKNISFIILFSCFLLMLSFLMFGCEARSQPKLERRHVARSNNISIKHEHEFKVLFAKTYAELTEQIASDSHGSGDLIIERQSDFIHLVKSSLNKNIAYGKLSRIHMHRMRETKKLDQPAMSFIKDLLENPDPIAQYAAIPVLTEAYKVAPASRKWVKQLLKEKINSANGSTKRTWKKVLIVMKSL